MKNDEEQSPLDIALERASKFYRSSSVDISYYLIMNCGCGGEVEKMKLLCRACYHGKLDLVKKLVVQHKVIPNCEYSNYTRREHILDVVKLKYYLVHVFGISQIFNQ